ncbi:MAG TPA: HDOD domain-containing protein [Deltaproteobacteria bacterium]|nr:HDOD domain-containing protein [Deltaproteobacteria bacterium]HPR55929.1 HDOD domain-containing protein [Deltaproteobacteria bacterium]HXK47792.1 HDOD domain-containing protein [Deltaproteobacteria bacterium]
MDIYIARQPIFTRNKSIYAYELLFREGMENCFPGTCGDSASSRVLSNTFFSSGIEQITGGKRAFINFTRELLVKKIPLIFPSEITTVEVLEDIVPDESVIDSCREISRLGYLIALDDFEYSPAMDPLIELSDIIKVDFSKSSPGEIQEYAERFGGNGKKLLAEKVETIEEFEKSLKLGYTYFQGYFFSKPQLIRKTDIPALKINVLGIMSEVGKEDYQVGKLQKLIEQDVGISYKLLRYLNSPYYRRVQEVSSIRQAIVMLGERGIKQFLSVIFLAELSQDKPDELLKSSIIRARICEELGKSAGGGADPSELFTLGLFSHIDAILDNSMDNIMKTLPLSSEIKSTLTGGVGVLKEYLDIAMSYEKARWDNVISSAGRLGIPPRVLPKIYWNAVQFADSVCTAGN